MKRGDKFTHKFFLDFNNQPMKCVVTAVRKGNVYWKQEGRKKADIYFRLQDIAESVMPQQNDLTTP